MGNVCAVSVSCDAIFTRCLDCTIGKAAYISDLEDNLLALQTELQKLVEARNDVLRRVTIAEQKQMKRIDQVQGWLSRVQAVEADVGELLKVQSQEITKLCLGGYCSKNCRSSYQFGKDVAKKLQLLASLKGEGDFKDVAERVPEDPADEVPIEPTIIGQQSALDEVWRSLAEKHVGIIGLYGTGGVGKTTLLKQLNNKFCNEGHDFDVVLWVVVSKDLKLEKIQEDIGRKLGVSIETWAYKSIEDKAREIFRILTRKKFVLFLDDIWESVDLIKVGVPIPNPNIASKVVFTTRFEEVCGKMEAQKKFRVECLAFEDAWKLFQMKVGDVLHNHPDIPELAKIVAKECGGLPLALNTIGRAMASKRAPEEWQDAIEFLRRSSAEFSGMDEVYPRLKFSYDRLPSDNLRSCFLYCSLFPEDHKISKSDLVDFFIGEGFLDGFDGSRARYRGYTIIGDLLRACLLEEEDDCVKMHDVVRDMALWIARDIEKEKGIFFVHTSAGLTEVPAIEKWRKVKKMSLMNNEIENLVDAPICPHLETLFLNNNSRLSRISGDFFKYMPSLKVLSLGGSWRLKELPLIGISKLVSIQYLDLSWIYITELPMELKALVNLKYLNLDYANKLGKIPLQLISGFSKLHVLRVLHCGLIVDAAEDSVLFNDGLPLLDELLVLKVLNALSISLKNSYVLERFLSSQKLQSCTQTLCLRRFKDSKSLNVSSLTAMKHLHTVYILDCQELEELKMGFIGQVQNIQEPHAFHKLQIVDIANCNALQDLTWLILAPILKQIKISGCKNMEVIISVANLGEVHKIMGNQIIPFEKLEFLHFFRLPNLKSIYWQALPFPCLNEMRVVECPKLKELPLDSNSTKERKIVITGEEDWWKELLWEDEATQSAFRHCFNSNLYSQ